MKKVLRCLSGFNKQEFFLKRFEDYLKKAMEVDVRTNKNRIFASFLEN